MLNIDKVSFGPTMPTPLLFHPVLFVCCFSFASSRSAAQRIHIGTPEGYLTVEVNDKKYPGPFDPKRDYHWYHSQTVHVTQGGSAGLLLHGSYQKFSHTGDLLESGRMKHGLKHGEWRTWHSNGRLKTVEPWRTGMLHGRLSRYNDKGELLTTSRYSNGKEKGIKSSGKRHSATEQDAGLDSGADTKEIKRPSKPEKQDKETRKERKSAAKTPEAGEKQKTPQEGTETTKKRGREKKVKE